jgi:hypothetical protein
MMGIPSIGIIEIIMIAGAAGMVLLAGGLVIALVARTQRDRRTQAEDQPGPDTTTSRSPKSGIWLLLLLGLIAVLALPLVVIAGGILIITPVRSSRTDYQGPAPQVDVVTMPTSAEAALVATPSNTPRPASQLSAESPPSEPASLSVSPDDDLLFVTLPGFAGLVALAGAVILALVLPRWRVRRWKGGDGQPRDQGTGEDDGGKWARKARLRYALLALAIWCALSILLILDVGFAVSVYLQFLAIYAAFWVLVGALLLVGSSRREKLLILGLIMVVLFSVRAVDWNSRKPFLKDFRRVREGMTVEQVEQIMADYLVETCYPIHPLGLPGGSPAVDTDELTLPDCMVYRHTNEDWGDSDLGEIRLEKGRVVEIQFLSD